MNEIQLKSENPWLEVAEMYSTDKNCIYDEKNDFVYSKDAKLIQSFNDYIETTKEKNDKIVTSIPVEPWWGNPLKARLIILSLNPGYVPEVNKTLGKLLQSNQSIHDALINYKAKTLRLEVNAFLPEPDSLQPISCRDAVNMLGDWYWYKKLRTLKEAIKIEEELFWQRIALVEFYGYSSQTSNHSFPWKNQYLDSQQFTKKLIWYIANRKEKEVRFLIMRSAKKWEELLNQGNENFFEKMEKKRIILCKENKGMSQAITEKNLGEDNFSEIVSLLKK